MQHFFHKAILCISFFSIVITSCTKANAKSTTPEYLKKYGNDVYYFLGLQAEQNSNDKEACKYFQKALSSKTKLISKLSAKELISLSSKSTALSYAANLYKTYADDESLIIYLEELYNNKNYDKILSLTKDIDYATTDDQIIFFKCAALLEKKDSSFPGIYNLWCSDKAFSNYHSRIFSMINETFDNDFAFASEIAKMQKAALVKDYGTASTYAKKILTDSNNLKPQVVSDAGKSLLYGSNAYETNASFLESLLTGNKEVDYYLHFYAGRLYSKQDEAIDKALENMSKAFSIADTDENYDNALWYYLTILQNKSLDEVVEKTKTYCTEWHDANYFDDFFESLSVQLLNEKKWERYYELTNAISEFASPEAVSKYCYTSASLIENNFFTPKEISDTEKKSLIKTLYEKALNGGCDSYHKLMAAAKLKLTDEETWSHFSLWSKNENFQANEEAEEILYGYIDFDLCDPIFSFWLEHYSEISMDCAAATSAYLYEKAKSDNDLYYTSLRVAAKKLNFSECDINKKLMELSFPRGFGETIEKYCDEYKLPSYIAHALIRMESFYSPNAISHAGAIGLCQLMETTADEIAKKLKLEDYELTNPDTNIQFGTNYLADLIRRMENTPLLAICSYNAGMGKIRSTLRNILTSLKKANIPNDIFLEMLPITETRKYGRDVTAASAIYAYLYFDKSPTKVIADIVKF